MLLYTLLKHTFCGCYYIIFNKNFSFCLLCFKTTFFSHFTFFSNFNWIRFFIIACIILYMELCLSIYSAERINKSLAEIPPILAIRWFTNRYLCLYNVQYKISIYDKWPENYILEIFFIFSSYLIEMLLIIVRIIW